MQDSPFAVNSWDITKKSPILIIYHIIALFTLLPIRIILSILVVIPMYLISFFFTSFKINPEYTQIKDLSKFKLFCISAEKFLMRIWLFLGYGLISIKIKGQQDPKCKITVAAPHASLLFDACVLLYTKKKMSVVASAHLIKEPFTGLISRMTEPIYVDRADPIQRKNCVKMMQHRIDNWDGGILIFPEGCITNGQCLANFRVGAFMFGQPVQPIVIRIKPAFSSYFKTNPGTWSQTGFNSDLGSNIMGMMQPFTTLELEFLDTYIPDQAEKENNEIFARNVAKYVASKVNEKGINSTDYISYDGHCIYKSVSINNYAHKTGMIGVERIKRITGTASHFIAHEIFNEFLKISNFIYDRKCNRYFTTKMVGYENSKSRIGQGHFINPVINFEGILKYYQNYNKLHPLNVNDFDTTIFQKKFDAAWDLNQIDSEKFCIAMAREYFELMSNLEVTETSEVVPEITDEKHEKLKDNFIFNLLMRHQGKLDMKMVNSPFHIYKHKLKAEIEEV